MHLRRVAAYGLMRLSPSAIPRDGPLVRHRSRPVRVMSALPLTMDVGRRTQVSIWLSVYEYTPSSQKPSGSGKWTNLVQRTLATLLYALHPRRRYTIARHLRHLGAQEIPSIFDPPRSRPMRNLP